MAMATLPEELPVGPDRVPRARRIGESPGAARSLAACPRLRRSESATVLCVDKTGTLTVNQMSLVAMDAGTGLLDA